MSMPPPEDPQKSLPATNRSLPIALMRAREQVMVPVRRMLAASGLSEQKWRVLRVLSERGPQDATTLAEHACLLMPSLTRILQSMEKADYIRREVDPADRRRQTVSILPKGQSLIDANRQEALRIAQGYRAMLGDQDYEKLLDLLEALHRGGQSDVAP